MLYPPFCCVLFRRGFNCVWRKFERRELSEVAHAMAAFAGIMDDMVTPIAMKIGHATKPYSLLALNAIALNVAASLGLEKRSYTPNRGSPQSDDAASSHPPKGPLRAGISLQFEWYLQLQV